MLLVVNITLRLGTVVVLGLCKPHMGNAWQLDIVPSVLACHRVYFTMTHCLLAVGPPVIA